MPGAMKNELCMHQNIKLNIIKTIHSLIWLFFNLIIFYLYYAAISNKINKWVWIGVGMVLLEGVVLLIFKRLCPITLIARNYSDSVKDNFDIFLPNWLARNNKLIYTTLFIIALVILIYRSLRG